MTAAPCLGITMGDPAGVGPEIIVKACRRLLPRISAGAMRLLVIGHRSALHAARDVLRETLDIPDYDGGRTQGVAMLAAPFSPPWGGCRFFCVDPDGYLVEIEQPA